MCILCVASRWSRRIVTRLPWLIFPLIILWALSQLLPPGIRFEVTSPRMACVLVILVSLLWYELAMPRLSSWRARRSALLRERKRMEQQEAEKWRKEATRRCRNCLSPYKDQTPAGGRFMCTYCGHVSKRPVLDIPGAPPGAIGAGTAGSVAPGSVPLPGTGSPGGLVNGGVYYVGRNRGVWGGGKGWIVGWPWANETGGWGLNGSWFGGTGYSGAGAGIWGVPWASFRGNILGNERCAAGESYSGLFLFALKIFSYGYLYLGSVWRKVWNEGWSGEESTNGMRGAYQRKGEDGGTSHGTRGEKSRRKAEEKRQARLEKEQLEAEERKQREEVARLVEERRKQRDEKLEAEKEGERDAAAERDREIRREMESERRRQEKAREREKGLVKDKPKEQDLEEAKKKKVKENEMRKDQEGNEKGEDRKPNMVNGVESRKSGKTLRVSAQETCSKRSDLSLKGAVGNALGMGGSKYLGSTKGVVSMPSKTAIFHTSNGTASWDSGLSTGLNLGKAATLSVPSSNLNRSAGSNGTVSEASGSAWNRISWTKVWGKGSVSEGVCNTQTGVVDSSSERSDGKIPDKSKQLIDGGPVSSNPLAPVGMPQPPIAPPSSQVKPWFSLFSSPSVFPPMELPVDSGDLMERKQQNEIKSQTTLTTMAHTSLAPSQLLFGTSDPIPPQSSESLSVQVPFAICASGPLVTSVHPTASCHVPPAPFDVMTLDDLGGMDMHNPLSLQGPASDAFLTSLPIDLETNISPSIDSDSPDYILRAISQPQVSKALESTEDNGPFGVEQQHQILEPWGEPRPFLSDDSSVIMGEDRWQMWDAPQLHPQLHQIKLPTLSPWLVPPNDAQMEQDRDLQVPLPQGTMQSEFEQENQLPSWLFPFQSRQQSSKENCSVVPVSNSNSIWSDSSFLETMCGWDGDNHHRVPPDFVDCITNELIQDPVITADGHSYDRTAIETWLKSHDTSPKTGEVLPPPPGGNGTGVDKTLRPNHILRGQIIEYKEHLEHGSMKLASFKIGTL